MRRITVGCLKIGKDERSAINSVLDSGMISEAERTHKFEEEWAKFIGTKYCVATSSGTASLITVLTAFKYLYNLKSRPKVITSPLTYISDANSIVLSGLEPVFVDVDPHTFCITAETIKQCLKKSNPSDYGVILPVDLMGYSVNIEEINKIAKDNDLLVLEDAAEAHGTLYKGHKCGSQALAGVFSFYIAHNISVGEMGSITTNNKELWELSKEIKSNGRMCKCRVCTRNKIKGCPVLGKGSGRLDNDPRFLHDVIGYNFKTMEFQSALALAQLKKVEDIIAKRSENVRFLNEGLVQFSDLLQLPLYDNKVSYLAYPIVIKNPERISRKQLRLELEKHGVETRPLFGCIPTQQPAYNYLSKKYRGKLKNAEYLGANAFYIGCHQYLSNEDLQYVITVFKKILKGKNAY